MTGLGIAMSARPCRRWGIRLMCLPPPPRYVGAMSLRTKFFALTYDRQMAKTEKAGLRSFREGLLAGASGDVLEIGGGTGANLSRYGPDVGSLTITEPQSPMLRHLERNVRTHCASQDGPDARVLRAPAEDLPFDDLSFDVAVSTLVLCGVDDQPRALRELRRVLRPAAVCCSSSTCGPMTRVRPACRTG
jgi:ubiquinone/menaquinone biosynthesis C-methylase UbiE